MPRWRRGKARLFLPYEVSSAVEQPLPCLKIRCCKNQSYQWVLNNSEVWAPSAFSVMFFHFACVMGRQNVAWCGARPTTQRDLYSSIKIPLSCLSIAGHWRVRGVFNTNVTHPPKRNCSNIWYNVTKLLQKTCPVAIYYRSKRIKSAGLG